MVEFPCAPFCELYYRRAVSVQCGLSPGKRGRRCVLRKVTVLREYTRYRRRKRKVLFACCRLVGTKLHPREPMMSIPAQGVTTMPRISKSDVGESC
jgi:hypothetical protein